MHLIIYCSKSCIPDETFSTEFWHLVADAAKRNRMLSVTGVLIFHDGWFVQALEGDKTIVSTLA